MRVRMTVLVQSSLARYRCGRRPARAAGSRPGAFAGGTGRPMRHGDVGGIVIAAECADYRSVGCDPVA
jgi:hypothetical protein